MEAAERSSIIGRVKVFAGKRGDRGEEEVAVVMVKEVGGSS